MELVNKSIEPNKLKQMAEKMFGNLVKAVIDIEKEVMVVDAEMHSDEEEFLLTDGSKQKNLWGINLYPDKFGGDFVEFDSMINLRPSQNNRSRSVEDAKIREKIISIVERLVRE